MKYACIACYRGTYEVRLMCQALGVSSSGFYAAQRRPPSARAQQDQRLRLAIRTAYADSHRRYGAPKIHAVLRAQGVRCGQKRVARLMQRDGLRGTTPRRFQVTTQSAHRLPIAGNHLNRQFSVAVQRERDRVWAADLTYIWTADGWLYLAVVLDVASRRVIGWCADARADESLTIRALTRALRLRQPAPGVVHHSDRGVQYAAHEIEAILSTREREVALLIARGLSNAEIGKELFISSMTSCHAPGSSAARYTASVRSSGARISRISAENAHRFSSDVGRFSRRETA